MIVRWIQGNGDLCGYMRPSERAEITGSTTSWSSDEKLPQAAKMAPSDQGLMCEVLSQSRRI